MEGTQSAGLYTIASLVMVVALVADFIWVISTAVHAMK
jgi:hypothetical protein